MPCNPEAHRSVSTWFPRELLHRLDQPLAARCALPGQRASRQDRIISAIKAALDAAPQEGAALSTHRARPAEATAVDAEVLAAQTGRES